MSKDVIQLLQSKIEQGAIREARQTAMKHLHGEHGKAIIAMFKKADHGKFFCQQCKRESDMKFNPLFLAYDTNRTICSDCEAQIEKAIKEQILMDKTEALNRWRNNHAFLIDNMIEQAGVPVIFQSATMKDLKPATVKILTTDQSYFIRGNVGVGKSHMAVAIMREYCGEVKPEYDDKSKEYYLHDELCYQPVFIEVPELLLRIRDTYNDKSNETEKDIVEFFTRTPFLVLDDLGTEKASEFSTLMLYLIINRRCTSDKTTIITSNLDLEQIEERLSDRISSRIKGMCLEIDMAGHDKRYESKTEQRKE